MLFLHVTKPKKEISCFTIRVNNAFRKLFGEVSKQVIYKLFLGLSRVRLYALIISLIISLLISSFISNKFNFSYNIFVKILQKTVVFSFIIILGIFVLF